MYAMHQDYVSVLVLFPVELVFLVKHIKYFFILFYLVFVLIFNVAATPQTNLVTNANPEWRFGYFTPQTTPTNAAGFVPFNHYGPYDVNLFAWSRSDNYPLVGFNTAFKTLNAMPMNSIIYFIIYYFYNC